MAPGAERAGARWGCIFLILLPGANLIISLRRRALTPFAWLRAYARGAVAPTGLLRSPVPVTGDALPVGVRDPHHGAVEGVGGAGQHRLMQNETPKTTTAATFGRSSIARLPPELREAVDAAIADGATIDEITALIRGEGGACSRSAVGRYTKNVRDLIRQQQETDRGIEMWVRALGDRPEGRAGLILVETLRTMTLSTLAELSKREEPATPEELSRLSLVLKRIEGTDKLRIERERAAAKEAAKTAPGAGQAPVRKGLSPEAVAAIREVVEGRPRAPERAVTSAPVDPWNPAESHLIPLNPGESRPENVSEASSSISLNGGRSLRSLAYAPFGAARSRALRTCGPAAVRNSPPPKARGAPCHVMAGLVPAIHRAAHPSRGMTEGDARNKSGHDEVGGPVGWIASPSMQTATAHSPSPPLRDKKWLAERAGVRSGH